MAKKTASKRNKETRDNLKRIEGIGSKLESLLNAQGISTYKQLARASQKRLKAILADAGRYYRMHDPSSWNRQAMLAAEKNWDQLKQLQDQLNVRSKLPDPSSTKSEASKSAPREETESASAVVAISHAGGGDFVPGQVFRIERILTTDEVAQEYSAREAELGTQFDRARATIENTVIPQLESLGLIESGQVTGVSARYRTKFGHPVSPLQVVIGVNVARKLPIDELKRRQIPIVATHYDGIPVKVVEGTFDLITAKGFFLSGNQSPKEALPFTEEIVGGIPVAPPNDLDDFGTLGLVTMIQDQVRQLIGVTCQHVVKKQPQTQQIDDAGGNREIGRTLLSILPANRNQTFSNVTESVDCASLDLRASPGEPALKEPPPGTWARGISHPINATPSATTAIPILFATRRANAIDTRLPLWKFGNGSGILMEGRIDILNNQAIYINRLRYRNNFTVHLTNSNGNFASPGDSGSLLAVEAKATIDGQPKDVFIAIGVLFAALHDGTTGLGCNMSHVIKALGLDNIIPQDRLTGTWSRR
ncbi:MAG: hypothetical protein KDB00_26070 [Planctomycetales bacterium]|nr:hypothetical protein [Planctomycetales bacterium]